MTYAELVGVEMGTGTTGVVAIAAAEVDEAGAAGAEDGPEVSVAVTGQMVVYSVTTVVTTVL